MVHSQPFRHWRVSLLNGERCLLMRSWCGKVTAGLSSRTAHFRQSLRSLCDHVYSTLQFLLQVGDIHLVRDAMGVADAFHIAVLDQFFQTAHCGYARQLQRVRDLTCANEVRQTRALRDYRATSGVLHQSNL